MNDYYAKFEQYLSTSKKVSLNTLESYLHDIGQYLSYLQTCALSPEQVTKKHLEAYIGTLKDSNRSASTITRNVASIRCFYQFLISEGQVEANPAKFLKLDKAPKKLPQILTGQEIEQLLAQPDIKEAKGCRDKAMLELLYATGIRVSELIDLNIQDVNLSRGLLFCRGGKSERVIPVYAAAISAVSDYIYRVRNLMITPEGGHALFINLNGSRLTRQGFWKIVKGYAESAKIVKEITPHTLRHSFALHLLENGADLKDIQVMMGHADISSTQVYVQLLDNHFKEVYNNCHPRAKIG